MSQSVKRSYIPDAPPYTLDLRPFLAGTSISLPWQPTQVITLHDADSEFTFEGMAVLNLVRTTQGFDIVGTLTGKALVPCSQCIGNTWVEDTFEIAESCSVRSVFDVEDEKKPVAPKAGSKLELHPQDFDEPVDLNEPFGLGELLRQVLITQLPAAAGCYTQDSETCPSFLG
jgi:hypothetical protein